MKMAEDLLEFVRYLQPENRADAVCIQSERGRKADGGTARNIERYRWTGVMRSLFQPEAVHVTQPTVDFSSSAQVFTAEKAILGPGLQGERTAYSEGISKFPGFRLGQILF